MQIKKIDSENVKDVYALSFAELGKESWSLPQFFDCLKDKNYITYLAYSKESLAGFLIAMKLVDSINLLLIATGSTYKNKGVGSQLMDLLIKSNATSNIWLEVKENNLPAINLYKKFGFKPIHRRKNYYKDGTSAIIFEKIALDF